jgi:ketosteroid isomerase-like protein
MAALEKHSTGLLKGNTVKLSLTGLETTSAGDIGYDVGTYSQTITPGTAGAKPMSERGKYVVILRRGADKQWKVKYAIYNSDLPPQPMK